MEDETSVHKLTVDITNRLTLVSGFAELGEREFALQALITCYELLTKLILLLEPYQ